MLVKQSFTEKYREMTFRWTGEESAALAFAIHREIERIDKFIKANPDYIFRDLDIANAKMLKSTLMDLHNYTIKP